MAESPGQANPPEPTLRTFAFWYPLLLWWEANAVAWFILSCIVPTFGGLYYQHVSPFPLVIHALTNLSDYARSSLGMIAGTFVLIIPTYRYLTGRDRRTLSMAFRIGGWLTGICLIGVLWILVVLWWSGVRDMA